MYLYCIALWWCSSSDEDIESAMQVVWGGIRWLFALPTRITWKATDVSVWCFICKR